MKSHEQVDARSLALARAVVSRIDADPKHRAVDAARKRCERWQRTAPCTDIELWTEVLRAPWPEIRSVLLDTSERGVRLRQSNPFCGVLSPRERWSMYRSFRHDARAA